jgi:DNA-binding protein Fis
MLTNDTLNAIIKQHYLVLVQISKNISVYESIKEDVAPPPLELISDVEALNQRKACDLLGAENHSVIQDAYNQWFDPSMIFKS